MLLKPKPLLLARPTKRQIAVVANNDHGFIEKIKSRIPPPVKNKVRIVEVASGRCAMLGLFSGTAIINTTGTSFYTQYTEYKLPIYAVCLLVALATAIPNREGVTKEQLAVGELRAYRTAMVFMVLIFSLEILMPFS